MATRSMRGRLTIFAFVLYVTLDLSNPFHPGAFNFNPEECVEAAYRQQQQHASIDGVSEAQPVRRQRAAATQSVTLRPPVPLPRAEWRAPVPVAHAASPGSSSSSSPSSPTEDH